MANAILVKGSYTESNTKTLFFNNITVAKSLWKSDSTYSQADYGFSAKIPCSGITEEYMPQVVFGIDEATSGKFAPICNSGEGIVTIYAKEIPDDDIKVTISATVEAE